MEERSRTRDFEPPSSVLDPHAAPLPPLDVLCEDGPVLAVNKPAGLLTQGVPQGVPTLEALVRTYVKAKYEKPGNVYLGIPHRLDRSTSGVIVFARNSKAAARLAEQFEQRRVKKEYLAAVEPAPPEDAGLLTDRLVKDANRAHVVVASPETAGAKEAAMRYRVIERNGPRALLLIEPLTGRMHQIRVQLSARGWPVVGDAQYGWKEPRVEDRELNETLRSPAAASAGAGSLGSPDVIALHARRLTILHPVRYDELPLVAPVPTAWASLGFGLIDV